MLKKNKKNPKNSYLKTAREAELIKPKTKTGCQMTQKRR